MAVSRDQLKTGQKIRVEAFEATVESPDSYNARVMVSDSDGNVHYVYLNQLGFAVPFEDGRQYLSAKGSVYTFRRQDDIIGYWTYGPDEQERDYDVPARPMSEVVIGTDEYGD